MLPIPSSEAFEFETGARKQTFILFHHERLNFQIKFREHMLNVADVLKA